MHVTSREMSIDDPVSVITSDDDHFCRQKVGQVRFS